MVLGRIKRLKEPTSLCRTNAGSTVLHQHLDGARLIDLGNDGHKPWAIGVELMASIAFMMRFSSTC